METALPEGPELDLIVADASVLVELVVAGRHRDGADVLLSRYATSPRLTPISAAHGLIEAISAVRRLVLNDDLGPGDGLAAVAWLGELDLVLDATAPRARRIWALRERMSAYAAAAEAFGAPLVTVDRRLLRACRDAGIAAIGLDDLIATSRAAQGVRSAIPATARAPIGPALAPRPAARTKPAAACSGRPG